MTCLTQNVCRTCGDPFTPILRDQHCCYYCQLLDFAKEVEKVSTPGRSAHPPLSTAGSSSEPARLITLAERGAEPRPATNFDGIHIRLLCKPDEWVELSIAIRNRLLELMNRYCVFRTVGCASDAALTLAEAKNLGAFYRRTFIERNYEIV